VSDVERIAQIRRRVPGLTHQWYGKDVPFLLAALDEANTRARRNLDLAYRWVDQEQKTRDERDRAVAQVERVREIVNQMSEMDGIGSEPLRYWAARITSELDSGR
jgi:hypothetical protein